MLGKRSSPALSSLVTVAFYSEFVLQHYIWPTPCLQYILHRSTILTVVSIWTFNTLFTFRVWWKKKRFILINQHLRISRNGLESVYAPSTVNPHKSKSLSSTLIYNIYQPERVKINKLGKFAACPFSNHRCPHLAIVNLINLEGNMFDSLGPGKMTNFAFWLWHNWNLGALHSHSPFLTFGTHLILPNTTKLPSVVILLWVGICKTAFTKSTYVKPYCVLLNPRLDRHFPLPLRYCTYIWSIVLLAYCPITALVMHTVLNWI